MAWDDFDFGGSGSGGYEYEADDWFDEASDSGQWMDTMEDDDWDFGSDLLDMGKELGGAVWDWGVKNPGTVLSGLATGAKGILEYYTREDTGPSGSETQTDYYERRKAQHDKGMRDYVASMKKG